MTKKDYIAIADALKNTLEVTGGWRSPDSNTASEATFLTYKSLVRLFTLDNPRFQEDTFYKAVFGKTR